MPTDQQKVCGQIPNYFGAVTSDPYWGTTDISQNLIYIGIFPFAMMILSLFHKKKREVIYLFFMAGCFFLITMGEHVPIYRLLFTYIPGFDHFRAPINLAFVFIFFAALLAGYGFECLLDRPKRNIIFLPIFLIFIMVLIFFFISPHPSATIGKEAVENISKGFIYFGISFSLFIILVVTYFYLPGFKKEMGLVFILFTFIDLYTALSGGTTLGDKISPDVFQKPIKEISVIRERGEMDRFDKLETSITEKDLSEGLFRVDTMPREQTMLGNLGFDRTMLHKLFLVDGNEPLILKKHAKLEEILSIKNYDNFLKINNVRYVLIKNSTTNMVQMNLYSYSLPRVFIVGRTHLIENDEQVLDALGRSTFNPFLEVILSENPNNITGRQDIVGRELGFSDWSSRIVAYTPDQIKIKTFSKYDGYLVFSDTYYPGWHGWVDNKEYPVLRANYNFKAIYLPKGEHIVSFKFIPASFTTGAIMTTLGFAIVIVTGFFYRKSRIPTEKIREKYD